MPGCVLIGVVQAAGLPPLLPARSRKAVQVLQQQAGAAYLVFTSLDAASGAAAAVVGSATEDRLDVVGVVAGGVGALRAGPGVVLVRLVVHVLDRATR